MSETPQSPQQAFDPTIRGFIRDLHERAKRASAYGEPEALEQLGRLLDHLPQDGEGSHLAPGMFCKLYKDDVTSHVVGIVCITAGGKVVVQAAWGRGGVDPKDLELLHNPDPNDPDVKDITALIQRDTATGTPNDSPPAAQSSPEAPSLSLRDRFKAKLREASDAAVGVADMLERMVGQFNTTYNVGLSNAATRFRQEAGWMRRIAPGDPDVIAGTPATVGVASPNTDAAAASNPKAKSFESCAATLDEVAGKIESHIISNPTTDTDPLVSHSLHLRHIALLMRRASTAVNDPGKHDPGLIWHKLGSITNV
jgi:hypothetical protein